MTNGTKIPFEADTIPSIVFAPYGNITGVYPFQLSKCTTRAGAMCNTTCTRRSHYNNGHHRERTYQKMREFNMECMVVVYKGEDWKHDMLPCSKAAIPYLEKNERIVSWLRPTQGGVSDEIPAIIYRSKYYSLSLRMQKAIYRHIRLRKGFKNVETMDGVNKLRIPDVLLREKIRTQSRFEAMRKCAKQTTTETNQPTEPTAGHDDPTEVAKPDDTISSSNVDKLQPGRRKRKVPSQRPQSSYQSNHSSYSNTVSAKIRDVLASLISQYDGPVDVPGPLTSFVRSSCMADLVAEYLTHEEIIEPCASHRSASILAFTEAYDAHVRLAYQNRPT